ncbi:hypothetical protein NBO_1173g0004 [Nosema bombycis CQ1]|uniref:Uncharacterized protein n=1 Tax=Nosema bombycis (strain CQ1 / CVCC 102059) TaxID=578461 RepID=R0M0C5_NOSB1|nr:hypothetical protein NBO_1173g0004 [Nosema bombycis CQ1]|eukprot:EOB11454.1 hypothetical protein NBO_1173g0004 [Nosema bombycis CQ1]
MHTFFIIFTFLFYAGLIIEVFFFREHLFDARLDFHENSKLFFYSCYLSVYSYVNIISLVFNKDITGLLTFFYVRIELFVTNLILFLIVDRAYYVLFVFGIDLGIYFYIFYIWDSIKSYIFQNYNKKIGSDTNIRKIFIQRSAYVSFQNFTYVNYALVILLRNQYEFNNALANTFLFVSIIPVFFSLVVRRFETEKEDKDAKLYAFISYLLTITLLISSFVIEAVTKDFINKFYLTYMMSLDLLHFLLLTIFCALDYRSFGKGLKVFYENKRVDKKIY